MRRGKSKVNSEVIDSPLRQNHICSAHVFNFVTFNNFLLTLLHWRNRRYTDPENSFPTLIDIPKIILTIPRWYFECYPNYFRTSIKIMESVKKNFLKCRGHRRSYSREAGNMQFNVLLSSMKSLECFFGP